MTERASHGRVIAVDLDGTLVRTDILAESIFLFIRKNPLATFKVFFWLLKGKVFLKEKLAGSVSPDFATLPYDPRVVAWVKEQRHQGAKVVLATASHHRIAVGVQEHLRIFDEVVGTTTKNLSSSGKRDELVVRYGHGGFEYVGNSPADLKVWAAASVAHVANSPSALLRRVRATSRVGNVFVNEGGYLSGFLRAVRLHQWAKNLLVFVPLLAAHRLFEGGLLWQAMLAFLCFGCCASSVYLLNDLLDLGDDRRHKTKKTRPLAAGTFPILHAMIWMPALLIASGVLAIVFLPIKFLLVIFCYYALTLLYSLWLKRIVMLDVVTLALLYTLRVIAGAAAVSLPTTFWILAFCMFIFLSLAFVKRYTELYHTRTRSSSERAPGRGYVGSDFEMLASLGASAGYVSVLVLGLYINDAVAQSLYRHPQWMWAACPLLLFWLSRVWLIAHRGEMQDDPIVFAFKDRVSQCIGLLLALAFLMAAL